MHVEAHADLDLLAAVRSAVPLVREPYAQIAAALGRDEQAVLADLSAMRQPSGIIREISAIFDATSLGYRQSLVAFRVPSADLDTAGVAAAGHPGVSHCYARDGVYNLWFTLAVSADTSLGLERTVELLAEMTAAERHMVLPAMERYKLAAPFDSAAPATRSDGSPSAMGSPPPVKLSPEQVRAIRALQTDLPNRPDPFAPLAKSAALDADMLLVHAAEMLAGGYMRRYSAVLHHRRAGARANVMVAWSLGGRDADLAGARCAEHSAVSHCFLRPAGPDWPYQLYTMIHGADRDQCDQAIAQLAEAIGPAERAELWTLLEYKKQRVRLFGDQQARWEQQYGRKD